ncbi:hypothetical protein NFI96_000294 [Prochilodus magdalenae]|nr:hypothetical protein NFI96_000294 [Prochilodus magdalenae]
MEKWMLRAVFVLAICLTRNLTSGSRIESFKVGSNIILQCTNTKIEWSELIYVIWKINSQKKNCTITVATNDTDHNTCQDGKYINKTGNYSLIIPDFSIKDEGIYTCDVSYRAGGYVETINVTAWIGPKMTKSWLEAKDGHISAVCEVQSLPAAPIHWETPWNSSSPKTHSTRNASGVFTVTSRLQLPPNASHKNLTCVVPASSFKGQDIRLTTFAFTGLFSITISPPVISAVSPAKPVEWPFILLGVCATCSIVSLLTGLYIMREKIGQLRVFKKICCSSQISPAPKDEKPPQPRDPEEVEPYASYVQRVNSIYNSSADLFNA